MWKAQESLAHPTAPIVVDESQAYGKDDVDTQVHPLMDDLAKQFANDKTPQFEYATFKKFGDSLLTKASKLTDLVADLEKAFEESGKSEDSFEGKRLTKYNTALESAIEILEKQYEQVDKVKAETCKLQKAKAGSPEAQTNLLRNLRKMVKDE
eukprot:Skav218890  [mRNA]  locus=scaffold328:112567:122918:- [translate_table: standard]